MRLVALGPMFSLGDYLLSATPTKMRGHAPPLVEDLYSCGSRSHFHQFLNQRIGHTVQVGLEGDVVIDVHSGALDVDQNVYPKNFSRQPAVKVALPACFLTI